MGCGVKVAQTKAKILVLTKLRLSRFRMLRPGMRRIELVDSDRTPGKFAKTSISRPTCFDNFTQRRYLHVGLFFKLTSFQLSCRANQQPPADSYRPGATSLQAIHRSTPRTAPFCLRFSWSPVDQVIERFCPSSSPLLHLQHLQVGVKQSVGFGDQLLVKPFLADPD